MLWPQLLGTRKLEIILINFLAGIQWVDYTVYIGYKQNRQSFIGWLHQELDPVKDLGMSKLGPKTPNC